jgi:hypothetical protein
MGFHQIKNLMHIKEYNYQNEETTHKMELQAILRTKNSFASYSTDKGFASITYKDFRKLKHQKNKYFFF